MSDLTIRERHGVSIDQGYCNVQEQHQTVRVVVADGMGGAKWADLTPSEASYIAAQIYHLVGKINERKEGNA